MKSVCELCQLNECNGCSQTEQDNCFQWLSTKKVNTQRLLQCSEQKRSRLWKCMFTCVRHARSSGLAMRAFLIWHQSSPFSIILHYGRRKIHYSIDERPSSITLSIKHLANICQHSNLGVIIFFYCPVSTPAIVSCSLPQRLLPWYFRIQLENRRPQLEDR